MKGESSSTYHRKEEKEEWQENLVSAEARLDSVGCWGHVRRVQHNVA